MNDSEHKDNWNRLIESYNRELMAQYATQAQASLVTPSAPSVIAEDPVEPATEPPAEEQKHDPVPDALTDTGQLQIRITTENQAYPIVGASVRISHETGDDRILDYAGITDENGTTPLINLPTKDRRLSLTPGNPAPFSTYTVEADADGYFKTVFNHLPIYGGVTAIQNISLIPLPERGDTNESLVYDTPAPSL